MLQLSYIRENRDEAIHRLAIKNFRSTEIIDEVIALDEERRATQKQLDDMLAKANSLAKEIGQFFKVLLHHSKSRHL